MLHTNQMVDVRSSDQQQATQATDEDVEYHQLEPIGVIKTEPIDDQNSTKCGTSGSNPTSEQIPAPVDNISGYNEEPEQNGGSINVDTAGNSNIEETTDDYQELSPINRRIQEEKSYNVGDWTSKELKALYDGIATYGTTKDAVEVIHRSFCATRALGEVVAKVEDIRSMCYEYAEDRMNSQCEYWIRTGYRNVRANPNRIVLPEINNWEAALQRVNRQIRSHSDYAVSTAITNAFLLAPKDAEAPSLYKVTDCSSGRGYGKEQSVSWQRLNEFFLGIIQHLRPLPPLNALECAIALQIVDDVEDEVCRSLTDSDKAIIRGWLANIKMRELRDFLPDSPYSADSAAQMLLDPLRTRNWTMFGYNIGTQVTPRDTDAPFI